MFSVNKIKLSEFKIVVPKYNSSFMVLREVDRLKNAVKKVCSTATVVNDDTKSTKYELIIGATNRDYAAPKLDRDQYNITVKGGKVFVTAGHTYSLSAGVKKLVSLIKSEVALNDGDTFNGTYEKSVKKLSGLKLTFADEFDGNEINTDYWDIFGGETGKSKGRNGLTSYRSNRKENLRVEDGCLKICASHDENGWYGGMVRSWNRVEWKHGYCEISAIIPDGKGFWTAFWMCQNRLPNDLLTAEIDIYECFGNAKVMAGNLHRWPTTKGKEEHSLTHTSLDGKQYSSKKRFTLENAESLGDEFHTYGFWWDEKCVKFTCDGKVYFQYRIDKQDIDKWCMKNPMYFILSQAVAFDMPCSPAPDETTDWVNKNKLIIEYLHVYQTSKGILNLTKPE